MHLLLLKTLSISAWLPSFKRLTGRVYYESKERDPSRESKSMRFYPEQSPIPTGLRDAEFILRPLRASDNELDYDAVMESKSMLRVWEQSDWPTDDFSLADNLKDLERHEREHQEGKAFTFTVMNSDETECLGCVYINPLASMLQKLNAGDDLIQTLGDDEAVVMFWVRRSQLPQGLDDRLLGALIDWFDQEWEFSRVLFSTNSSSPRQVDRFTARALKLHYALEIPGKKVKNLIYG